MTELVAEKPGLRLMRNVLREQSSYEIRSDEEQILEMFTPTRQCRGNKLRALALKTFNSKTRQEYMGQWPLLTVRGEEVRVGDVLVYERRLGDVLFTLVVSQQRSYLESIDTVGGTHQWLVPSLSAKLQSRKVYAIELQEVPEKFRGVLESYLPK